MAETIKPFKLVNKCRRLTDAKFIYIYLQSILLTFSFRQVRLSLEPLNMVLQIKTIVKQSLTIVSADKPCFSTVNLYTQLDHFCDFGLPGAYPFTRKNVKYSTSFFIWRSLEMNPQYSNTIIFILLRRLQCKII